MLVKYPSCKGADEREATDEQTGNKFPNNQRRLRRENHEKI